MLNTVSECNEELGRIDSEIERLTLERHHVLAVRKFLQKPKQRHPETQRQRAVLMPEKQRVLNIVELNPGIDGRGVFEEMGSGIDTRKITFWLSDLRRWGYIENRGGRGRAARWYRVEKT